jgi:hypothetical protein
VRPLDKRLLCAIFLTCLLTVGISGTATAQQQASAHNGQHGTGGHKKKHKLTCKIRVGKHARRSHAIKRHIELEIVNQSDALLNFGEHRNTKRDVILLKASRPLPKGVRPGQFELDTLIPLRRIGSETDESKELTRPKYSRLHIFDHRERISFALCVDASNGHAGAFAGQYLLSGPAGISSATITQTVQLKATLCTFLKLLAIALIVTALALWLTRIAPAKSGQPTTGQFIAVVLGLIAAGFAMFLAYSETPTWGADLFPSIAALVGTGFAAAGLGSIASSGATRADLGKFSAYFPNPADPKENREIEKPSPGHRGAENGGETEAAPRPAPAPPPDD